MNCLICGNPMARAKEWLYACAVCRFYHSTLTPGAGRGVDGLESLRQKNFRIIIDRLKNHAGLEKLKCLEVGPAEGWFMDAMQAGKADISGIEPTAHHAHVLENKGYECIHGFFPNDLPPGEKYDVIAFNDVFEHVPDPAGAIRQCENFLNDGGLLLLNLPNNRGFLYRLALILDKAGMELPLERLWQKDFPSPHITYFSEKSLEKFLRQYTALHIIDRFYLPSFMREGLKERLQKSWGGAPMLVLYAILCALLPVYKHMPQDIMVFICKKDNATLIEN